MDEKDSTIGRDDSAQKLDRLVEALANGAGDAESTDSKAELAKVLLSEHYSGSFPHPDVLRQFASVIENGAERAFALTEREQQHRHDCDKQLIKSQIDCKAKEAYDRRLLIILAFVLLVFCLAGTLVAIMTGHPIATIVGGGGALVGIGSLVAILRRFPGKASQS